MTTSDVLLVEDGLRVFRGDIQPTCSSVEEMIEMAFASGYRMGREDPAEAPFLYRVMTAQQGILQDF
jgi:hypothetical protein